MCIITLNAILGFQIANYIKTKGTKVLNSKRAMVNHSQLPLLTGTKIYSILIFIRDEIFVGSTCLHEQITIRYLLM